MLVESAESQSPLLAEFTSIAARGIGICGEHGDVANSLAVSQESAGGIVNSRRRV
jgi:hypothetical protein